MSSVDEMLAQLTSLDRAALAERWKLTFGVPAPKSCQATLLRCALAHDIQMKALQKLVGSREAAAGSRSLRRAAAGSSGPSGLAAGTRLLREWQGRTHHVTVLSAGFEYEGRTWRSLSAIARSITGTPWSGPAFFGLRS